MVEQKKDVVFVPYWIARALELNNLPLSTILDYRKMAQYVSAQEQGNMLLFEDFNPFKTKVVGDRHTPTYGLEVVAGETSITEHAFTSPLYEAWRKCVSGSSDANDNKLFKNLEVMNSLSWNQMAEQEVAMRFDPANAGRIAHNHPFITYDVEREFLIVVVYPAFFESASYADNVVSLCKEVLKVLYVYNTPASGCKTPYFRKYLESLA
jgi:hypothetical protein